MSKEEIVNFKILPSPNICQYCIRVETYARVKNRIFTATEHLCGLCLLKALFSSELTLDSSIEAFKCPYDDDIQASYFCPHHPQFLSDLEEEDPEKASHYRYLIKLLPHGEIASIDDYWNMAYSSYLPFVERDGERTRRSFKDLVAEKEAGTLNIDELSEATIARLNARDYITLPREEFKAKDCFKRMAVYAKDAIEAYSHSAVALVHKVTPDEANFLASRGYPVPERITKAIPIKSMLQQDYWDERLRPLKRLKGFPSVALTLTIRALPHRSLLDDLIMQKACTPPTMNAICRLQFIDDGYYEIVRTPKLVNGRIVYREKIRITEHIATPNPSPEKVRKVKLWYVNRMIRAMKKRRIPQEIIDDVFHFKVDRNGKLYFIYMNPLKLSVLEVGTGSRYKKQIEALLQNKDFKSLLSLLADLDADINPELLAKLENGTFTPSDIDALIKQLTQYTIHTHILLFFFPFIPFQWLQDLWKKVTREYLNKQGDFISPESFRVRIDKVRTRNAFSYVMKYLRKTLEDEEEIPPNILLCWAADKRLVTTGKVTRKLIVFLCE